MHHIRIVQILQCSKHSKCCASPLVCKCRKCSKCYVSTLVCKCSKCYASTLVCQCRKCSKYSKCSKCSKFYAPTLVCPGWQAAGRLLPVVAVLLKPNLTSPLLTSQVPQPTCYWHLAVGEPCLEVKDKHRWDC